MSTTACCAAIAPLVSTTTSRVCNPQPTYNNEGKKEVLILFCLGASLGNTLGLLLDQFSELCLVVLKVLCRNGFGLSFPQAKARATALSTISWPQIFYFK